MDDTDQQIAFLREKLEILREQMPETPLDAERKAMEIGLIEEQLAELYEQRGAPAKAEPDHRLDDLTSQIGAITDELMELEIKMLKAEMSGDDSEKVKLQLSANALKSRRQTLIDEVRSLNRPQERTSADGLEARVEALEKEVADLKALLYRLMTRE
jgi:small-conductance mechanosensitive channel